MPALRRAFMVGLLLATQAAQADESRVYTLYRGSAVVAGIRIHVATFDTEDATDKAPDYNRDNCLIAAELFARQPGVIVPYWCERGRYKP